MDTSYSFELLVKAYYDCRRNKRNTDSQLRFEHQLERNLIDLHEELESESYRPGRSICFVITKPKPREVWAAEFRDRIVHHLLYNQISERFVRRFIADSCACIPGRGTLYAAQRLESKVRSQTQNWTQSGWYLKCDLANFFVSIHKPTLWRLLERRIHATWWRNLCATVLFHDPRENVEIHGERSLLRLVPSHKRLMQAPTDCGLPIGNLSSQFFANVMLDALDQHIKHTVKARHYIRYVDDLVLLHESTDWLNAALSGINSFLPSLKLQLNPRKTVLQPISRGVDFAGHVIKPYRRQVRRRTVRSAMAQIENIQPVDALPTINSYLGLMKHTSGYQDRAKVARAARKRGHSVAWDASKAYARQTKGTST